MPMLSFRYYLEYNHFVLLTLSPLRKPVVYLFPVTLSFDLFSRHLNALINLRTRQN